MSAIKVSIGTKGDQFQFRPADQPDLKAQICRPSGEWPDYLQRLIEVIQNVQDVERVSLVTRYTMVIHVRPELNELGQLFIERQVKVALQEYFAPVLESCN